MNRLVHQLTLIATDIDITSLAHGAMLMISITQPSQHTLDSLWALKKQDLLDQIDITIPTTPGQVKMERYNGLYQFAAFFDDVLQRGQVFHLFVQDLGIIKAESPVVTPYAGERLSSVPYREIFIGMEVLSAKQMPGRIVGIYTAKGDEDWLHVKWNNGKDSNDNHFNFQEVKVK